MQGETESTLKYAFDGTNTVVVSGSTDYTQLSGLKNAILELKKNYFTSTDGISIKGNEKEELDRRFLLIEHEVDGLLRRRIEFAAKDYEGGERTLDFTNLLNEKENQIVELEKKIQNLEERLRRASAREIELENKIVTLRGEVLTLRDKSLTGERLEQALNREAEIDRVTKEIETLKSNFAAAASIWKSQISRVTAKYPSERFELDTQITDILNRTSVRTFNVGEIQTVEVHSEKVIEVPVQDSRTKHLIHMLATNLKRLSGKYPKLLEEIDGRLVEFFQQELIDVIEVDELDRIVEIVKFVPQSVRVENVYSHCSMKTRKVEFHLRVLIKALLEELEKIKIKTGLVLEIDEGVIGMINQEIMGVVDVDDILKVFRVVPKIVEVEKIVEKVVEKVVEVPQVIPVEKVVEKVIEVPKFQEIEKTVHVPVEIVKVVDNVVEKVIEIPSTSEKVVEVPRIIEKIVEKVIEVPKVVEVEKIVEKVVVNTEVVEIPVPKNHIINEPKEVVVNRDKPVVVEKVIEKIV